MAFKLGERVKIINNKGHYAPVGSLGTIRGIFPLSLQDYSVDVDGFDGGHTCGGLLSKASGQYLREENFQVIKPKLSIYNNKNIVYVKLVEDGRIKAEACAKCSPDDSFDILIGAQIALQRLVEKVGSKVVVPKEIQKHIKVSFDENVEAVD